MVLGDARISPGRAARFRDRPSALIAEYLDEDDIADCVPLNVLIAVYSENAAAGAETGVESGIETGAGTGSESKSRQRDAG